MNQLLLTPRTYLYLGLLASIVVGIGEYLLHFLPEGPEGEVVMLNNVPLERAGIGHFFVVLGAPFYFAGYYGLMRVFQHTDAFLARLLFICGIFSFSIGGVWVASRYFAAVVLQNSLGTSNYDTFLTAYEDHYQVLVWGLRILIVVISIIYVWLILKNQEGYPKCLVIWNPIFLLIIIISSLVWFKPLGVHIAPIAMNVAHFVFFIIGLHCFKNYIPEHRSN